MPLRKSELMVNELNEFLDTLPQIPCSDPPTSRYFCTVCERLNKSVQKNCRIYKSHTEQVGLGERPYRLPAGEDLMGPARPGEESDSVEFKIVGDNGEEDLDSEMPLFEIVKPKVDETEPLEMSLLEDEAVEFDLMKDEDIPFSEDAVEVEPIEVEEIDEDFTGIEVEPLEVEEIIEEEPEAAAPAVAPAAPAAAPKKPAVKHKVKVKPKAKAKVAKRKAVKKPVAAKAPIPVAATTAPTPATVPTPAPQPKPAPAASQDQLIKDIEEQLVIGSPCTQCGSTLTNPRFCTQCGAKVIVSVDGVRTVPQ